MADPDAAEAARALNRLRWGNRVAVRAAEVATERIEELPDAEVVRMAHNAAEEVERRRLVARAEGR